MQDGTEVMYGKHGTTVYKAYRQGGDWNYRYTLVPVNGGRKRYGVPSHEIRPVVEASQRVSARTSAGLVNRPKSFRSRYPEYSGCTRRAYVGKEWVFKVAKYPGDNYKNRIEAAQYAVQTGMGLDKARQTFGTDAVHALRRWEGVPIAECHLLPDGVLMMERVKSVNNLNADEGADEINYDEQRKLGYRRPAWAGAVDCDQIGYNRKGELVAYDL
jgi:hypothetical protein